MSLHLALVKTRRRNLLLLNGWNVLQTIVYLPAGRDTSSIMDTYETVTIGSLLLNLYLTSGHIITLV